MSNSNKMVRVFGKKILVRLLGILKKFFFFLVTGIYGVRFTKFKGILGQLYELESVW